MNLSRPAFLDDSVIEIDILRPPGSQSEVVDNLRIYLELSKVQSWLMTHLRTAKGSHREAGLMNEILGKMDYIWQLNKEACFYVISYFCVVGHN